MKITGTLVWYYFVCKREVWLMAHNIVPFPDDPFLELGRFLHEKSYLRDRKEVSIDNLKFDLIKRKEGEVLIGEVKKSSKFIKPAMMQLAFYLLKLKKEYGIKCRGILLIPSERKRIEVKLTEEIETELMNAIREIKTIVKMDHPPSPQRIPYCKNCAYHEFCWVE